MDLSMNSGISMNSGRNLVGPALSSLYASFPLESAHPGRGNVVEQDLSGVVRTATAELEEMVVAVEAAMQMGHRCLSTLRALQERISSLAAPGSDGFSDGGGMMKNPPMFPGMADSVTSHMRFNDPIGKPASAVSGNNAGDSDLARRRIFVRNLAWKTTTKGLLGALAGYGEVEECVVLADRLTGKSRGYGFVTYWDAASAERALSNPPRLIDGRAATLHLAALGGVKATDGGEWRQNEQQQQQQQQQRHQQQQRTSPPGTSSWPVPIPQQYTPANNNGGNWYNNSSSPRYQNSPPRYQNSPPPPPGTH